MTTYISIIRGINVSGRNIIKMDVLRKLYEDFGFRNVTTYIQSGNVVFDGNDFEINNLGQIIAEQIKKNLELDVSVFVLTVDQLKRIIDNNPFLNDPDKKSVSFYVTFMLSVPVVYNKKTIACKTHDEEEICFLDNVIYLYCPNGYGRTKLTNNYLEAELKVVATTRNWKTVNELLRIAQQTKSNSKTKAK